MTCEFDQAGNRISIAAPVSSAVYTHDPRTRLTNETKTLDGSPYTTLLEYDAASHLSRLTYPDGNQLSYGYDALDRVSQAGSFASFTYTKDDNMKTITYGNGIQTTYTCDNRGRPKDQPSTTSTDPTTG